MKWKHQLFIIILLICAFSLSNYKKVHNMKADGILVAHLSSPDHSGFSQLKAAFEERNEGYTLQYAANTKAIESIGNTIIFIQQGGGTATLSTGEQSKFSVGDIISLTPSTALQSDSLLSALIFTVPDTFPSNIPTFIRPDWDMNITDTPGGCATETNAYRRILLTWRNKVGPYLFHSLNAHRVRIMDSFSHYHPIKGGFDEFYLVQMAQPKARIITSNKVDQIEEFQNLTEKDAGNLLQSTPINVGDLVYLPRGVMHRGLGGVLAQVITVPGFIPGSEIGVDHHLRAINEKLKLKGEAALPYNEAASTSAIIK